VVEARLGDLGVDRENFTLKPGEEANFHPRFVGEVNLTNARPGMQVYAQLDGAQPDSVPLVWKEVTAGRHIVSFSGPGVLPWTAELRVASGQTTNYDAQPQPTGVEGDINISSTVVSDRGASEGMGDAVFLDTRSAGRTPLTLRVAGGVHSVRVEHRGAEPQVQLVDLKPGQERYVKAEFDGVPRARVEVAPPYGSRDLPVIAATFHPARNEALREMRLYYAGLGDLAFSARKMTLLDPNRGAYAAPLPNLDDQHPGWRYYVLAIDADYNEIASEVLVYGKEPRGPKPHPANGSDEE